VQRYAGGKRGVQRRRWHHGGGDGDSAGDGGGTSTTCGRNWPTPSAGTCDLTPGTTAEILLRGTLILPDQALEGAELLVTNGIIACAGCDCASLPGYSSATILSCGTAVISPGLINAHDHITFTESDPIPHGTTRYNHRHEWRKGLNGKPKLSVSSNSHSLGNAWGEMRQVIAGTTSLFGSGGYRGFLRNLEVASYLEGLTHGLADYSTFPLGDSAGLLATSGCPYDFADDPAMAASFAAYVPHVGEGIGLDARNEFLCVSGTVADSQDLVFPTSAFIHGIGFKAADIGFLAAGGTGLVWSPRSNTDLYGVTAEAPVYDRLGVLIALGTDWTASGSMSILRELRCAQSWNDTYWGGYFSDRDLVAMVTSWSADLLGYGDVLGSLVPGKAADVSVFSSTPGLGYRAILNAGPASVALMLRGGNPLYGDQALVAGLSTAGECESLDVCGTDKALCAERELGTTLASLQAELGNSAYGLFFCAEPSLEPSCTPLRPGEFDGIPTETDGDGDGIDDIVDNCPEIFNPGLPVDGGAQADSDGDLLGDTCDPCPLNATTTACSTVDPNDTDGDGFSNAADNSARSAALKTKAGNAI